MIDRLTAAARFLNKAYPDAAWSMRDEGAYSDLQWLDTQTPRPTDEVFEAGVAAELAAEAATEYTRLRARAYPPLSELADALYWNSTGDSTLLSVYMAKVAAVKAEYPKGE